MSELHPHRQCTRCQCCWPIEHFELSYRKDGERKTVCRDCRKSDARRRYAANPDPVKAARSEYVRTNKPVLAEKRRADRKAEVQTLATPYLKKLLSNRGRIAFDAIPDELVKLKRDEMSLRRLASEMQQAITKESE